MYIDCIIPKNLEKVEKYYFNKNDLHQLVLDLIMNYPNIYYYVLSLIFTDNDLYAAYSINQKTIYFNLKNSKKLIRNKKFYNNFDHYTYLNCELLIILFHEIRHAEQAKIINEDNSLLQELFYKELCFEANNKEFYHNNAHIFSVERDATITALLNVLKFLKQKDHKELYEHFCYTLRNRLLVGYYYDEFPNQKMAKQLNMKPIYDTDMDLFNRLRYGFYTTPNDRTDLYYNFDKYLNKQIIKK